MTPSLRALFFLLLTLAAAPMAQAQVVTTDPAFPTEDDDVTVFFHADRGSRGLAGFSGDVYAHTGVITDRSAVKDGCGGVSWRHVKTNWGQNTPATKLERVEGNLYKLELGDLRAYYGVPTGEEILRLAFVFRSADSQREGKGDGNCDIFVDLARQAVSVAFVAPAVSVLDPLIVSADTTLAVTAIAGTNGAPLAGIRLFVDGAEVAAVENDTLVYDLALDAPGRRDVMAVAATLTGDADTTSFYAVYRAATPEAPRPAGARDGINYGGDATTATLSLFAPFKDYVYVLGDFNDWEVRPDYQMSRHAVTEDSVHYWITLDGLEPGREYAFQYYVDGQIRIADPYTEKVLMSEDQYISAATYPGLKPYPTGRTQHAVSVLQTAQDEYDWRVDDFERPEPHKLVVYEMLLRDFVAKHDYATLADTLGYLQRLGVNAIELMPIMEFEGNESWGYNPAFYFAPDKYYGPADDLKRFVDEAHARGIAVILDIVPNHSYGQSPLARMYFEGGKPASNNPWYNREHSFQNPDAHWGYDFNHESTATQYFFDRMLRYWLEEYRVDGYRFDFTKGITNAIKSASSDPWGSRYDASRIRLLKRMVDAMWTAEPGAYAIFEHLSENSEEKVLADYGILLWGNMNHSYNEATMGYTSDLTWGFYGARGWSEPGLVTYMESHDEERLMFKNLNYGASRSGYDVKDLSVALDRQKLAGAFFFTVPGPKMIWQFGELGYDVSINADCRVCNKPIRWQYLADPLRRKLYDTWSALLHLRHDHEVFTSPETKVTQSVRTALKVLALEHGSMNAVVVGNFGVTAASWAPSFPSEGTWYEFFSGETRNSAQDDVLLLQPGEVRLYTSADVGTAPPGLITVDAEDDGAADLPTALLLDQNYPNPFNPATTIRYALPTAGAVRLAVFDVLGRQVATLVDEVRAAGAHTVTFDARDLPSGAYLYRLEMGGRVETRRMLLVK